MRVALAAHHRAAEPDGRHVADAVGVVLGDVLLGLGPALFGGLEQAVVPAGHLLLDRWIRQQVARQLFGGELVERLVLVERADHVIAVRRDVTRVVAVVSSRVGEPHEVEPVDRHPLPEVRRGEQPLDQLSIRIGPGVIDERGDIFRLRRESREVKRQPADERHAVGFRCRCQLVLSKCDVNKSIDRVASRADFSSRHSGLHERLIGPMPLPVRPLLDPGVEDRLLPSVERLLGLRRRHHLFWIVVEDPTDQFALVGLPRDHCPRLLRRPAQPEFAVEPQIRLAGVVVRPVTGKAMLRQDRPHIAVELDPLRKRRFGGDDRGGGPDDSPGEHRSDEVN